MISASEEQTKKLAAEFANTLKGGEVVFLEGDLGSGKTTFVRGVVEAFGFDEPVRSPTFTIMNQYPVSRDQIKSILHLDLYRIEDGSELEALALKEELGQPDAVTFIEWPMNALEHYGIQATNTIKFRTEGTEHKIEIN